MTEKLSTLILLPNLLHEEEVDFRHFLPMIVEEKVLSLDGIIAESEKAARRYLKRFTYPEGRSFREVPIRLLNEHTVSADLEELLAPVLKGERWGLISDAGLPCLADPGANLVALARLKKIKVEAVSGPSSLFLALMLSGLSAQRFWFYGYLEREPALLRSEIKKLEKESLQQKTTLLCIEAPYRSQALFQALVQELDPSSKLSVCVNLTASDEQVSTFSVKEWRKLSPPDLHKKPVIFVFAAR